MITMGKEISSQDTLIMQQRLISKRCRQKLKPLQTETSQYKKFTKRIVDSDRTNHERTKYMLELLFAVYCHAQEDASFNLIWQCNEFMSMIHDLLDSQLRLCVSPFNAQNGDGILAHLYKSFPDMINMFSVGKKNKIVRAGIFLQSQILHLQSHCPDALLHQANHATKLNEVMIEHHHSGMEMLLRGLDVGFQQIREASIHLRKKSSENKILRTLFDLDGALKKSKRRNEFQIAQKNV